MKRWLGILAGVLALFAGSAAGAGGADSAGAAGEPRSAAPPLEHPDSTATLDERITFYLERLGDSTYVEQHEIEPGEFVPWYTAAEELGVIGAPALPALMERLATSGDDYERTFVFYALRLASQDPAIKYGLWLEGPYGVAAYPEAAAHPELRERWLAWWDENGDPIRCLLPWLRARAE